MTDEQVGMACTGILKAFLKALPGDVTVDEVLVSLCETPQDDITKMVTEIKAEHGIGQWGSVQ